MDDAADQKKKIAERKFGEHVIQKKRLLNSAIDSDIEMFLVAHVVGRISEEVDRNTINGFEFGSQRLREGQDNR
jgi:hypothetical protein